ncbi:hypothetical protein [Nonomuraea sp. NPDC046570]
MFVACGRGPARSRHLSHVGSHTVYVSQPAAVADLIRQAAA